MTCNISLQSILQGGSIQQSDYFQTLLSCSIACNVIYEKDPKAALKKQFYNFNHNIKSICVSQTEDDLGGIDSNEVSQKEKISPISFKSDLTVKYMVCDTSTNKDQKKQLIVAFRGTHTVQDIFSDLKIIGQVNNIRGSFHAGIYRRAQMIPLDFFKTKVEQGYEVVFTGHSLGGAIASIVASLLLAEPSLTVVHHQNVKCMAFGAPLVANKYFNEYIDKSNHTNRFHFLILENDPVPRLLTLLTNYFYANDNNNNNNNNNNINQEQSKYKQASPPLPLPLQRQQEYHKLFIEQCTKFLQGEYVGNVGTEIIGYFFPHLIGKQAGEVMFTAVKNITRIVSKLVKTVLVPEYTPFGNHIHITLEEDDNIMMDTKDKTYTRVMTEFQQDTIYEYKLTSLLPLNGGDCAYTVNNFQQHTMNSYFNELKFFFDKFWPEYAVNTWKDSILHYFAPSKISNMKDLKIMENNGEGSYYDVRAVMNETTCDLFLTLRMPNMAYIRIVEVEKFGRGRPTVQHGDSMTFMFTCANDQVISKDGEFINNRLKMRIISHFNTLDSKVRLPKEPEPGLDAKTIRIATLEVDKLYLYAISHLFTMQKLMKKTRKLSTQFQTDVDQMKQILDTIDSHMSLKGISIDRRADELQLEFYNCVLEGSYMSLEEANMNYDIRCNGLSNHDYTDSFKTLLAKTTSSICAYKHELGSTLKLKNPRERIGLGGLGLGLGALILSGALLIPGLPVALAGLGGALIGLTTSAPNFYLAYHLYQLSKQSDEYYKSNLKHFVSALSITEALLPYSYYLEDAIRRECEKRGILNNKAETLRNWNKIFKERDYISNIQVKEREKAFTMLKVICENAKIREIVLRGRFIGILGLKNAGKSTFIEQVLHEKANASLQHTTTEVTPYVLHDDIIVLDYPHYESTNVEQKIQFLASRYLLDHVFAIYDAAQSIDSTSVTDHVSMIRQAVNGQFTVLLNCADRLWRVKDCYLNERDMMEKRQNFCFFTQMNIQKVHHTCLDTSELERKDILKLKSVNILQASEVRLLLFDLLKDMFDNTELLDEKLKQLNAKDVIPVQEFSFVKRSVENDSDDIVIKYTLAKLLESAPNLQALIKRLSKSMNCTGTQLVAIESQEVISSLDQLKRHEEDKFELKTQGERRLDNYSSFINTLLLLLLILLVSSLLICG